MVVKPFISVCFDEPFAPPALWCGSVSPQNSLIILNLPMAFRKHAMSVNLLSSLNQSICAVCTRLIGILYQVPLISIRCMLLIVSNFYL